MAANVKRLMDAQNLTYSALVAKLAPIRPIPLLGLRKIVVGERRVDADDLVALAVALGVSPATLLYPPAGIRSEDMVEVTGVGEMTALNAWGWLVAELAPGMEENMPFYARSWPEWVRRNAEAIWAARGDDQ